MLNFSLPIMVTTSPASRELFETVCGLLLRDAGYLTPPGGPHCVDQWSGRVYHAPSPDFMELVVWNVIARFGVEFLDVETEKGHANATLLTGAALASVLDAVSNRLRDASDALKGVEPDSVAERSESFSAGVREFLTHHGWPTSEAGNRASDILQTLLGKLGIVHSTCKWVNDGRHDLDIARYVLETDEFVNLVTTRASAELKRTTRNAHLSFASAIAHGTPETLISVVEAVYLQLKNDHHIQYEYERGFDEVTGEQNVRLPQLVGREGRGTCMDLVLLFLGCLANVKLWPVYVQVAGGTDANSAFEHALAGTWVEAPSADRRTFIDPARLLSSVASGRFLALDCTGFVEGHPGRQHKLSFDEARKEALERLNEAHVRFALDVRRAWEKGVQVLA